MWFQFIIAHGLQIKISQGRDAQSRIQQSPKCRESSCPLPGKRGKASISLGNDMWQSPQPWSAELLLGLLYANMVDWQQGRSQCPQPLKTPTTSHTARLSGPRFPGTKKRDLKGRICQGLRDHHPGGWALLSPGSTFLAAFVVSLPASLNSN